jgi:4-amino-4-deoxy-L-arabinose transferase-like glycosyltransferase
MLLILAVAITTVFLAVRQMSHSLWFDEIQTANIAQAPTLPDLVKKAIQDRPYPPLYFLFDRASWKLRRDETGLRLPSAVFGALTTIAIYLLGITFFRARTAAAAALLFCLAPGMFSYFIDANAYTLLALTSTLSAWTLWRALVSDRAGDWALYVAVAAAGLACHSLFVFHIGSHFLAGLAWTRSVRWSRQPRFYKAIAVVFLLWLAWVVFYRLNHGLVYPIMWRRLADGNLGSVFLATYAGFLRRGPKVEPFAWLVLQVAGAFTLFLRDKRLLVFLFLLIVPPLICISLFTHATLTYTTFRYGSGIFPLTCFMGASALEASFGRLAKLALSVVMIVALAAGASVVADAPVGFFDSQDWKGVAALLAQNSAPGDTLLLDPGWSREALDYYDHSNLAREEMEGAAAFQPKIIAYCSAHSTGRKWLIASWESRQMADAFRRRLQDSGPVSLGPPRRFTGISVYPLSCRP